MSNISIKLPIAVSKALHFLESSKDTRLTTLCMLTQPRSCNKSGIYYEACDYEKMWRNLAKHEEKRGTDINSYKWVLDFVDDVIDAQKLPKYYYLKNESRLELITHLQSLKDEMVQIFLENKNSLNPRLREALNRKNLPSNEGLKKHSLYQSPAFDFIEALKFYTSDLIKDVASVDDLQNDNAGIEQRMFIIALIKRNQFLYQKDLLEVVAVTIWALFEVFKTMGVLSLMKKRAKEI